MWQPSVILKFLTGITVASLLRKRIPFDLKKKERKWIRLKLATKLFVVFIFRKTGYRLRATMGLRLRIHPQFLKNSNFTCSTILCKINLRQELWRAPAFVPSVPVWGKSFARFCLFLRYLHHIDSPESWSHNGHLWLYREVALHSSRVEHTLHDLIKNRIKNSLAIYTLSFL